jgi:HlyD family secretion protein
VTPFARIYIPETARAQIAIGKTMNVFVDGYQKPFVGKVSKIANNPSYTPYYALTDDERQRLMYLAEIQLDTSANAIPNGLPVKVEL